MKKRVFILLSTLAVLLCLLPAALAASSAGGACGGEGDGSAVQWSFNSRTGTLTISGKGPMADYDSMYAAPWYSLRSQITSLVIEEGVTYVGIYSLCSLSCQDAALELPESLTLSLLQPQAVTAAETETGLIWLTSDPDVVQVQTGSGGTIVAVVVIAIMAVLAVGLVIASSRKPKIK